MTPSRRSEEIERMLRRLVDEFEPSSPRSLDAYYPSDEGDLLGTVVVPDGLDALLEAAEILLNNTPEGDEGMES